MESITSDKKLDKLIKYIIWYKKYTNKNIIQKIQNKLNIDDDELIFLKNKKINNLDNDDLSNLKLQKILYFLYGYYYGFAAYKKFKNKELFEERFEAWPYGPVIKEVYDYYFRYKEIIEKNDNLDYLQEEFESDFELMEIRKIKKILDYLFKCSPWLLVDLSHTTSPWKDVVKLKKYGTKISNESIKKFFIDKFDVYEKRFN